MITNFPITPNWAEKDALLFGYPKLKPTVPLPTSQIPKHQYLFQGYSLSRNHLKQNGKSRERLELISICTTTTQVGNTHIILGVLDTGPLRYCNNKETQKDIPQIKRQLLPQMGSHKRCLFAVVFVIRIGVDTERAFLVYVGPSDTDSNWEYRNIHHDCAM